MGESMRRIAVLLLASLIVVAGATASPRSDDLVKKAVQAMGGESALANVKTVAVKGTMRQWEPEQSVMPGGDMRLANDSTFEIVADYGARASRVDVVKNFVYPAPRTYTFSEVITPDAGYVIGIDSMGRTKQSMEANPPAHAMSGLRLATTQREMRRASPMMFLDMLRNPDRVTDAPDITVGDVAYPAVSYTVNGQTFIVAFDPQTHLPARSRSLDYDNVWGDVNYDLVLSDWRPMGGQQVATTRLYQLNGRTIFDQKITDVQTNVPVAADRLMIPADVKASAAKPATGNVPYQWVIRRQVIGTYLDSDNPSFDTRATSSLRLNELGPGIQHVVGGTHHSLIVEMKDYLIVFDAPVSDGHSNWVLDAARQKFGNKPVKYLVLTHHHMDHTGGFRAYAAQGAIIVVGKGAAEHFRRALAAPYRRNPDLTASRDLTGTQIIEVAEKQVLTDGQREVVLYNAENPHAHAFLIGYLPAERLGFVTDLWSPGAPMGPTLNPNQAAVIATVKRFGISPLKFAGGHGSTADYAALVALEGK